MWLYWFASNNKITNGRRVANEWKRCVRRITDKNAPRNSEGRFLIDETLRASRKCHYPWIGGILRSFSVSFALLVFVNVYVLLTSNDSVAIRGKSVIRVWSTFLDYVEKYLPRGRKATFHKCQWWGRWVVDSQHSRFFVLHNSTLIHVEFHLFILYRSIKYPTNVCLVALCLFTEIISPVTFLRYRYHLPRWRNRDCGRGKMLIFPLLRAPRTVKAINCWCSFFANY